MTMIFGKETETLEFKKTTGELREAVISIASILNKSGKLITHPSVLTIIHKFTIFSLTNPTQSV